MLFTSKIDTAIFDGDLCSLMDVAADAAFGIMLKLQAIDSVLIDCSPEFSVECTKPALGDECITFRVVLDLLGAQAEAEVFFERVDGEWEVPTSDDICFAFLESEVVFAETRLGGAIQETLERLEKSRSEKVAFYARLQAADFQKV